MTNNSNPMPITMDDNITPPNPYTPSHAVHHSLIDALLSQVTNHIDMLVETKFNAMVENRRALHLMDQALETLIDQKIDRAVEQAMTEHEVNTDHYSKDEVEGIAADQARETLSEYAERQEGWVTKDQVNDLITEHVDEELDMIDWDEKVKDVLREML